MRRIAAVFIVVATLGAAYAMFASADDEGTSSTPAETAGPRPLLVVKGRDAAQPGDGIAIEGERSFLRIRGARGFDTYDARFTGDVYDLSKPVLAGRYRVAAYTRTCAGTCAYLDPPSDRCARRFAIAKDEVVTVTITSRSAHRCRIAIARSS
jgi:hypothetical protein